MVPSHNQMLTNGLEALTDYEQQSADTVSLEAIKLTFEQTFASFLEALTALEQDPADRLLKSIKACRTDLEENTKFLKVHTSLLKELMNKVNDIRTISRDAAAKSEVPLPLKKNKQKSRSSGFSKMEIDTAMKSTQTKITDYF